MEIRIPVREWPCAIPDWAHQFDLTSRLLYPLLSLFARNQPAAIAMPSTLLSRQSPRAPRISSCAVPALSLFFDSLASASPFFVIGSFPISFSFSISSALAAGAAAPVLAAELGCHKPGHQLEMCQCRAATTLFPSSTRLRLGRSHSQWRANNPCLLEI